MNCYLNSAVLVPPCQDPPTRRYRLRTDKDSAAFVNLQVRKFHSKHGNENAFMSEAGLGKEVSLSPIDNVSK